MSKEKLGKAKHQWLNERAKREHEMDLMIKNCKPIGIHEKNKNKKEKNDKENN